MTYKKAYIYPIKHKPFKRLFDILFSLLVLILLSPVYLAIAIIIMASSSGSPFYISPRPGRGGKLIYCIKFRTMYKDSDTLLHKLLSQNEELKKEWDEYQKIKKDPRITAIGHFLRRTSLDELPQFINVLIGDLSIVGPRPFVLLNNGKDLQKEIKNYLGPSADKVLSVRPGITGIWQVSGRSNISIEEKRKMEELYVDKQSFFFDLKLILKTIPKIFFNKGAF